MEKRMVEAVHLLRKHVIKSRKAGLAVTYQCKECGKNGADTVAEILHLKDCRLASLLALVGVEVKVEAPMVCQPPTGTTPSTTRPTTTKKIKDPLTALDECTS